MKKKINWTLGWGILICWKSFKSLCLQKSSSPLSVSKRVNCLNFPPIISLQILLTINCLPFHLNLSPFQHPSRSIHQSTNIYWVTIPIFFASSYHLFLSDFKSTSLSSQPWKRAIELYYPANSSAISSRSQEEDF